MSKYILSIDQGTTSTRCLFFDTKTFTIKGAHRLEHRQRTPNPGWLEHDPEEIFANTVLTIKMAYQSLAATVGESPAVVCAGITNQRETTVAWSRKTGKALFNAIVWSDLRTEDLVDDFVKTAGKGDVGFLRTKCGLPCSPYFSAFKMAWMLRNVPEVAQARDSGDLMFGTIETWLIFKLTGGKSHVTDVTNASRTMLMDISTRKFSQDLCDLFGIPMNALPTIVANSGNFGSILCNDVECPAVKGIAITGCIGDQQGALFGHACFEPGQAKNTYGTGCFLLANVGTAPVFSKHGLLTTVGYQMDLDGPCTYALEGAIGGAGSTIQWMRDKMGFYREAHESDALAASVANTGGVVFIPAMGGLLAPHWRPDARGSILGMTFQTTKAHLVRAAFEGITMQVADVISAMAKDAGVQFSILNVDGGMVASRILMQMQADVANIPVAVPNLLETTALGAALCAGIGAGVWNSTSEVRGALKKDACDHNEGLKKVYRSSICPQERAHRRKAFNEGIQRSLNWSHL